MRVLVVDDDPWTLDVLDLALVMDGHEVLQASDGAEGLVRSRDHQPDLVVVDWMMPVMDGISMIRRLRSDSRLKPLPILMLTAKSLNSDVWAGWQAGVDSYVTKPLDLNEFRAEIGRLSGAAVTTARGADQEPGGPGAARLRKRWVTSVSEAIAARDLTLLEVAKAGSVAPAVMANILAGIACPRPDTIVSVSCHLDLELDTAPAGSEPDHRG